MREKLKEICNVRARFRGRFEKFGHRTSAGYLRQMALLRDITDSNGNEMCDHIWLNLTERVKALDPQPGDQIEFTARVRPYTKGYYDNRRRDYRLSHPTAFVKIGVMTKEGSGILFADMEKAKA
jgi:hypothetical protein